MNSVFSKIKDIKTKGLNKRGQYLIISFLSIFLAKGINMIGNKIFTNIISAEELSFYLLLLKMAAFIAGIAAMNLPLAVLRLGTEYDVKKDIEEERSLITTVIFLVLGVFVIIILLLELVIPLGYYLFPAENYQFSLILVFAMGAFSLIGSVINSYNQVKKASKVFFVLIVFPAILFYIFGFIFFLIFKFEEYSLIFSYIISYGSIFSLVLYLILKNTGFGRISVKKIKELFIFSSPVMIVNYISIFLNLFLFPLMVYNQENADLAIYYYCSSIANLSLIFSHVVRASYQLEIFKLHDQKRFNIIQTITKRSTRILLLLICPVVLLVYSISSQLILLFYNEDYLSGTLIVVIILLSNLITYLGQISSNGVIMKKRTKISGITTFISLILMFLSGIILIPILGINGLAISILLKTVIDFILRFITSQYCFKVNFSLIKTVLIFSLNLILIFSFLVIKLILNQPDWLIACISIIFYLFLIIIFRLINKDDLKYISYLIN